MMNEHKKQLVRAKARVGLVVTACLVVIFLAVLLAGNLQDLFSPHVTVYAQFDDVKGLQQGAPVWFSGIQVGTVASLQLTDGGKIRVPLSVKRSVLSFLRKDSPATVVTLGLLGDKYVEIGPGSRGAEGLKPGDTLPGAEHAGTAADIGGLVSRMQSKKGTVGRLLDEDTLYRDLAASVKDIKTFAATIKTSGGTLDRIIKDPALYERFSRASESLDHFTRKLAASKGTMTRLLEDESLYNNINLAAVKLNVLLDRVTAGEGTVGKLVTDRQLSEDLQRTLNEVNGLVSDIKKDPKKYFSFSVF